MKTLKETKILGFPLWMFLILAALMMVMAANDWMLTNMVGALAFAMVVGTLLGWVGDHIPVWKTWFGGGMLFACLVAGAFNTFNLIGEGYRPQGREPGHVLWRAGQVCRRRGRIPQRPGLRRHPTRGSPAGLRPRHQGRRGAVRPVSGFVQDASRSLRCFGLLLFACWVRKF